MKVVRVGHTLQQRGSRISWLEWIVEHTSYLAEDIWDSVAETLVILWQGCSFHADWFQVVADPSRWASYGVTYVWASSNGASGAAGGGRKHEGRKRAAWLGSMQTVRCKADSFARVDATRAATWKQMVQRSESKGGWKCWKKFRTCCVGLYKEITILNHMELFKNLIWDDNDNLIWIQYGGNEKLPSYIGIFSSTMK